MPWEARRNGHRYYYRRERRGGRAVGRYVGAGPLGEFHAREVEVGRLERARDRARLREAAEADRGLDEAVRPLRGAADAARDRFMAAAGWHRPKRGPWRRRRATMTKDIPERFWAAGDYLARANGGDDADLVRLGDAMDRDPTIAGTYGDIARAAREVLMPHLAQGSGTQMALERRMEELEAELAGPDPTPIGRLLAARAVLDWALLYRAEMDWDQSGMSIAQANYQAGRLDRLHRKYLRSLRALADVRRVCAGVRIGRLDVHMDRPPTPLGPAAIDGTCNPLEAPP